MATIMKYLPRLGENKIYIEFDKFSGELENHTHKKEIGGGGGRGRGRERGGGGGGGGQKKIDGKRPKKLWEMERYNRNDDKSGKREREKEREKERESEREIEHKIG